MVRIFSKKGSPTCSTKNGASIFVNKLKEHELGKPASLIFRVNTVRTMSVMTGHACSPVRLTNKSVLLPCNYMENICLRKD